MTRAIYRIMLMYPASRRELGLMHYATATASTLLAGQWFPANIVAFDPLAVERLLALVLGVEHELLAQARVDVFACADAVDRTAVELVAEFVCEQDEANACPGGESHRAADAARCIDAPKDDEITEPSSKTKAPDKVRLNDPKDEAGEFKHLGGCKSDRWNSLLLNQMVNSLRLADLSEAELSNLMHGCVSAMAGIGPQDELEGMMAAQLIAAHHAAMECCGTAFTSTASSPPKRSPAGVRSRRSSRPCASSRRKFEGPGKLPCNARVRVNRPHAFASVPTHVFRIFPYACGIGRQSRPKSLILMARPRGIEPMFSP